MGQLRTGNKRHKRAIVVLHERKKAAEVALKADRAVVPKPA